MADDVADNKKNSGGGKKKVIIIIVAVVLLLAAGGGAFFFLSGNDDKPAAEVQEVIDQEVVIEAADAKVGNAFYVGMPRPFVFNVSGYSRDRLVQIKVQLLVRGIDNDTAARKHIPLIEDTLLTIFSNSSAEKLATRIGKDELRVDALNAVQAALKPIVGNPVVEKVLFIGFVMQ